MMDILRQNRKRGMTSMEQEKKEHNRTLDALANSGSITKSVG